MKPLLLFFALLTLPTFANLAGFDVPDNRPIRPIDGVDQTDLLLG